MYLWTPITSVHVTIFDFFSTAAFASAEYLESSSETKAPLKKKKIISYSWLFISQPPKEKTEQSTKTQTAAWFAGRA